MSVSVDETLLPRQVNLSTSFRELEFCVGMSPVWLKHIEDLLEAMDDGKWWWGRVRDIRQHPTKHQLYGHLPPIMKIIQVRRTRHAGHCWRSKDKLISDVPLLNPTHMAEQKQDNQLEHTYSSYVRIRDVDLKTYLRRWTIEKSGERGAGISKLAARHEDDDDDDDLLQLT